MGVWVRVCVGRGRAEGVGGSGGEEGGPVRMRAVVCARVLTCLLTRSHVCVRVFVKEMNARIVCMTRAGAIDNLLLLSRFLSMQDACYLLMQYHCGGSLAKIIEEFGFLNETTSR